MGHYFRAVTIFVELFKEYIIAHDCQVGLSFIY